MALWFDIQTVVTHSYRCWVFELACKRIRLTFKSLAAVGVHLNLLCDCLAKQYRALGHNIVEVQQLLSIIIFFLSMYLASFALLFLNVL